MSIAAIDVESMLGPFGDPQTRRLAEEVIELRKQTALDRQSREASQSEFARLNRELNEATDTAQKLGALYSESANALFEERSRARDVESTLAGTLEELWTERARIGALLDEIASVAIAASMMDPACRGLLDVTKAIQFLRQTKEEYERNRA